MVVEFRNADEPGLGGLARHGGRHGGSVFRPRGGSEHSRWLYPTPQGYGIVLLRAAPIGMTERRVGDDHCGAGWFGLRSRPSQAPAPVQRTVDRDKYCIEVVTQIAAATKALEAVASMLLDEYLRHCVSNAVRADGIVTDETIQGSLRGDRTSRALLSIPLRKE